MFTLPVDDEIVLRLADRHQIHDLFALAQANRDRLLQHMFWIRHCRSLDEMRTVIRQSRRDFARQRAITAHIFYQDAIVGWVRLHSIDSQHKKGELSYWLGAAYEGKGIVTRAARAMLDYALTTLGLVRVIIQSADNNPRSRAVAERLNFTYEGCQKQAIRMLDGLHDVHLYSMVAQDWPVTMHNPIFAKRLDDHIVLRPFSPADAAQLFEQVDANRRHLQRWLPWVDSTTRVEDTQDFIYRALEQYATENGVQLGIWHEESIVGAVGFHYWDFEHCKTEIGYWLVKSAQGQGIMTRVVQALCDYAFEELALERITIQCAAGNERSCAVPERLGFTHEGVARGGQWLNGQYVDLNIYALLANQDTA